MIIPNKVKRLLSDSGRAALALMTVFLVVYFITVVSGSSAFVGDSAQKSALSYFEEDINRAETLVNAHYDNLYEIVEKVRYAETRAEVEAVIESYIGSDKFGDLRYYSQKKAYAANGALVTEELSGGEYISRLCTSDTRGCSPVYYDIATQLDCIAFFVPVRGSLYIDGLLSVVPARNIINVGAVINEKASAVVIIDEGGRVLSDTTAADYNVNIGNNFYDFLDSVTHDRSESQMVAGAVASGEKTACTITTPGGSYTLAMAPLATFEGHLILVSMSESDGLIAPELSYIRHIINLLIIALIALVVGFVYAMLYHKKTKEAMSAALLVDRHLDCPNQEQFHRSMEDIVYTARRKYAVVALSVRNFNYLRETLGEETFTEVLKSLAKIIKYLTKAYECFGYAGEGRFLLLMINANSHSIHDKLKLIETLINREPVLKEKEIRLKFVVGAYSITSTYRRTVQEMIDRANTACKYAENNTKDAYTLFTDEVKEELARNEKIETIMESALKSREFRLFLQPKYDVKQDRIDSGEALVRWFDVNTGEYMFPGEFIPLFETNGFIVKLDHFMYIEVLEYLSHAVERGEKVVPIAVNVSRVTASSDDFVNFYVGNKKKYRIPDGFITLELTESFAVENYEKLSQIVTALHNSGMRCSVDDFGSGYSSFSMLKQITVDEIKLDTVFTKRGVDTKRDDKLYATIIDLAKTMGMRIVQEGVETKEIFDKVSAMGCDVIQGFYYAKAIPLEEFKIFVNSNTSIKYKSLVK